MIKIYTDWSCLWNPWRGGWGAILIQGNEEQIISGWEANTTNNRMELQAVISALRQAGQSKSVQIYTDSNYVKKGTTERIKKWKQNWRKTGKKEPVKNKELWEELDSLTGNFHIDWFWVKWHSTDKYNNMVDKIARKAAS